MYFDNIEIERFILSAMMRQYRIGDFLDFEEMYQLVKEEWPTVSQKKFRKIFNRCVYQLESR